MARVVLIVDSDTGALIDITGIGRESGRYARFAKRMLSLDQNPTLDFGVNGGDSLTISKGGSRGKAVNIIVDLLNVSGDIKSNGKTMAEIAETRIATVLGMIKGLQGEIKVDTKQDAETGKNYIEISLDSTLSAKLEQIEEELRDLAPENFISKSELSDALDGIDIGGDDSFEDVREKFSTLVDRLKALAEG